MPAVEQLGNNILLAVWGCMLMKVGSAIYAYKKSLGPLALVIRLFRSTSRMPNDRSSNSLAREVLFGESEVEDDQLKTCQDYGTLARGGPDPSGRRTSVCNAQVR